MVKALSEYVCDVCYKKHKTLEKAEKCEDACTKKQKAENTKIEILEKSYLRPRMNARSIPEFISMVNEEVINSDKKRKDFNLTFRNVTFSSNIRWSINGFPASGSSDYSGFQLNISHGYLGDFGDSITNRFKLYTGCGSGDGKRYSYYAYVFLDDLPLVKQAILENEKMRREYSETINALNNSYKEKYKTDPKIAQYDEESNKLYRLLALSNKNKKDYVVENYNAPAKILYDRIDEPKLNDIGFIEKSDDMYPPLPIDLIYMG